MRYQLFKLFNAFVGLIPSPIMKRMLQAMHYHPEIADRQGYIVTPQVFYSPFPNPQEVDLEKLKEKRDLPGVNFNMEETKNLMGELAKLSVETRNFIKNRPPGTLTIWDMTYPVADSATLYAMLRHLKPRNYIEVGCGWSSRCSAAALDRNRVEGHACKATYIDPYPAPHLAEVKLPGEFLKQKVERIPLERFLQLEAGDVLFIDTSHVIKTQNDVEYELIHVLPSLKPGVIVHIHDILTPYDYPVDWTVGPGTQRNGINEQYALECLLSGGEDWEVILPVHLLSKDHRPLLAQLIDADGRPAAFWIRKLRKTAQEKNG
ncbi:MAG: hypothetical protein JWQ04_1882 [Pedosphaera sp.]|nr:hypothetical protein [Pedosphaera sp.]